jgi:group I intron endonuclease
MNLLNEAVIYWIRLPEHTNIATQGYVGVSKNVSRRITEHLRDLVATTHTNPHLKYAFNKYGWDRFIIDIFFCGHEDFCYLLENDLRPTKNIGWNITIGGHRGPGWPKGKKPSASSLKKATATKLKRYGNRKELREKERKKLVEENRQARAQRNAKKLEAHQKEVAERKLKRKQVREEKQAKLKILRDKERIKAKTEKEKKKSVGRPICPTCNQRPRAISGYRNKKVVYRSQCGQCIAIANGKQPAKPRWELAGYKKKAVCDRCGFRSKYSAQLLVYHVDTNLNNCKAANLRTICLNCVVDIKKTDLPWRLGDLESDL